MPSKNCLFYSLYIFECKTVKWTGTTVAQNPSSHTSNQISANIAVARCLWCVGVLWAAMNVFREFCCQYYASIVRISIFLPFPPSSQGFGFASSFLSAHSSFYLQLHCGQLLYIYKEIYMNDNNIKPDPLVVYICQYLWSTHFNTKRTNGTWEYHVCSLHFSNRIWIRIILRPRSYLYLFIIYLRFTPLRPLVTHLLPHLPHHIAPYSLNMAGVLLPICGFVPCSQSWQDNGYVDEDIVQCLFGTQYIHILNCVRRGCYVRHAIFASKIIEPREI